MTLTTEVRIDWPVSARQLLDHVTIAAGGDPETVLRVEHPDGVRNRAMQGLEALLWVYYSEAPDVGDDDWPKPPALVTLNIDTPYRSQNVQAYKLLPAVVDWLDEQGVPRDQWWWEDETAATFHPGTTDVRLLLDAGERETWVAS